MGLFVNKLGAARHSARLLRTRLAIELGSFGSLVQRERAGFEQGTDLESLAESGLFRHLGSFGNRTLACGPGWHLCPAVALMRAPGNAGSSDLSWIRSGG